LQFCAAELQRNNCVDTNHPECNDGEGRREVSGVRRCDSSAPSSSRWSRSRRARRGERRVLFCRSQLARPPPPYNHVLSNVALLADCGGAAAPIAIAEPHAGGCAAARQAPRAGRDEVRPLPLRAGSRCTRRSSTDGDRGGAAALTRWPRNTSPHVFRLAGPGTALGRSHRARRPRGELLTGTRRRCSQHCPRGAQHGVQS